MALKLSAPIAIVMGQLKVIDASALVAILFGEEGAEAVVSKVDDAELIAPTLLDYELANVCLVKLRRENTQRSKLLKIYAARNEIDITRLDVDADAVLALAEATGLTAYDANYLWLAQSQNAELVTLDKKLEAAFLQVR